MFKKRTLIIAEAGVNHNGNLKIAKKLINAAKKCGADYIKFQTFNPKLMTTPQSNIAPYQKKIKLGETKQLRMLQKLSLSKDDFSISQWQPFHQQHHHQLAELNDPVQLVPFFVLELD